MLISNSLSSTSSDSSIASPFSCQVCGKLGAGKHLGAYTCRACATFFRRYSGTKKLKPCKKKNDCDFMRNGYFNCKKCRLQRCFDIGMKSEFEKSIDLIDSAKMFISADTNPVLPVVKFTATRSPSPLLIIPPTMDTFLGRSNLIIFCAPKENSDMNYKQFIDVRFLVDSAVNVLTSGLETPVFASNSLEKLALGLGNIHNSPAKFQTKFIEKIGKEEFLALWQDDMLKIAKWLTYFDEFQQLPLQLKIQILKGIWRVWSRLDRLVTTMIGRKRDICQDNMLMLDLEDNPVVFNLKEVKIDLSWQSRYNVEELRLFGYSYLDEKTEDLIQEMINLELTDVELSFMMCQLCFYYVGKRFQGVILDVVERLQEILSNDLHEYYTNNSRSQKYSVRITSMMRINNEIQKGIYERRAKADLMRIFDVFYVEYSDTEMFVDA
ncbi:hypothetical protein GCK72_020080 [Caenorhabditis remanei]|uniref:Uncharacterized protein n=1 Tax=Caenorhabditis remanei TaxID=31234 RepID=A0A6A5GFT2_CAERE|nr:hypothetical protein GCK72_020080 [Caenorhabditis remanei]KAF1753523.1 hypothetical protein GCK72_020080 [Caenorhabditis remanei]